MTHNGYCPGRADSGHIDYVVAERVRVEPYLRGGGPDRRR
jgi:hypothetical protein